MKIALFGNEFSQNYIKYIKHLVQKLGERDIKILIHQQFYDFLQESIDFNDNIQIFERISKQDNIDLIDFINSINSFDQVKLKKLINKYRYIYKMQRRRRRNLTYRKKRTQLAYKNLALSKLLDTYDVDEPLTRHMRRETIRSIMDY